MTNWRGLRRDDEVQALAGMTKPAKHRTHQQKHAEPPPDNDVRRNFVDTKPPVGNISPDLPDSRCAQRQHASVPAMAMNMRIDCERLVNGGRLEWGADGNRRQINNEERVLETSNVVKPANEGDKKQANDYDQASAKH